MYSIAPLHFSKYRHCLLLLSTLASIGITNANAKEIVDLSKTTDHGKPVTELKGKYRGDDIPLMHLMQRNEPGNEKRNGIMIAGYCKESREKTFDRYLLLMDIISHSFSIKGEKPDKDVLVISLCDEGFATTNGIALLINSVNLAKINTRTGGSVDDKSNDMVRSQGKGGKKAELVYPIRAIMLDAKVVNLKNPESEYKENDELTGVWRKKIGDWNAGLVETAIEAAYKDRITKNK